MGGKLVPVTNLRLFCLFLIHSLFAPIFKRFFAMSITILGAGLTGLSCSHFLGHNNCILFEKHDYLGGHIATHYRNGCYWDEGPHVSFTKHEDVRELLTWSSSSPVLDYPTNVGNFFQGHWIPHPAQSNMSFIPQPLARECYEDFISSRSTADALDLHSPVHYGEWLNRAFGQTFAKVFPTAYTEKYWTCHPDLLTVDWVGERVYCPDIDTVKQGYLGVMDRNTHYIKSVRYPESGGYYAFAHGLSSSVNAKTGKQLVEIDLREHKLKFNDGTLHFYDRLINTLPLNQFIGLICHAPESIIESAMKLNCSELLLVNISAKGPTLRPYHWIYVYDKDMYSTRINQTHLLADKNTPSDVIGIQVEVYASRYRPFPESHEKIAQKVVNEILALGLVTEVVSMHTQYVSHANIIFDHQRRKNQDNILDWLSGFGLQREEGDLEPMTDWKVAKNVSLTDLNLAGRFGQWKYFWTDDCILRGKQLSGRLLS